MSEVEIVVTGKNLAKAAFASASADTDALKKRAADLALQLRRAELSAASAGTAAERAFATAAAAADKAAASATAAADAQAKLAREEISAEDAAKADALAQEELAKANDAAARAALAGERASIAQAGAAKKAGEASAASAAENSRMAAGMEKLRSVGKVALEGLVVGAAAVGVESVKMAMSWQSSMIRLVTSAGESGKIINNQLTGDIKKVSDGLLKLSGDTATSADELAKAMYYVESAGFQAAKGGLDVMKAAAQGAKAENADVTTVTKALTDVLVDYHLKASAAADITSKMVTAVSHGKTNLQDFSAAFASIIPAGSAAGISFNDLAAALANMTNHGFTAQRASQNLAQALRSLLNPTGPMVKAFAEFGVSADTLKAKLHGPNGLTDAMQYLAEAASKAGKEGTPEFAAALKRLMGTAPGANAAIATVGANIDATNATIRDMAKSTADANGNVKGFSEIQKTLAFQVGQVVDKVKAWVTQLGMGLIPKLSEALGWLNKHTGVLKVLAGVIGGALLVAIGAYTVSMASAAVATIAATWPILAVVAAIGLLVAGLMYAYNHSKTFRDFTKKVWDDIKIAWDEAKKHWELIVAAIMGPLGILVIYFKRHTDELKKIWAAVWKELQKDWKSFESGPLKDIQHGLDAVKKWWKQNGADIVTAVKHYWAVISLEIGLALALIEGNVKVILSAIKDAWRTGWGLIRDYVKLVWGIITDTISTAMHAIHNVIAVVSDLIHGRWSKLWTDLKKLVLQGLADIGKLFIDSTRNWGTLLWDAGKNVIKGMIDGINSMVGAVGSTMSNITNVIRSHLPFSPAKVGPLSGEGSPDKSGAKIAAMLADGMLSGSSVVEAAAAHLAHVAHEQHMKMLKHHAHRARKPSHPAAGGSSSSGSGGGGGGYVSDLVWSAGGVRYTVGGAGRSTGAGGSAAGSSGGSSPVGSGQRLEVDFATLRIELDLKDTSGRFSEEDLRELRKHVRIRGGNVQRVLGH